MEQFKVRKFVPDKINQIKTLSDIDTLIWKSIEEFKINKTFVKIENYQFENGNFTRKEYQITLPNDSLILLFHLYLKNNLSESNFLVAGTENLNENITTLFISENNKIITTIKFKVQKSLERSVSYQYKDKRK